MTEPKIKPWVFLRDIFDVQTSTRNVGGHQDSDKTRFEFFKGLHSVRLLSVTVDTLTHDVSEGEVARNVISPEI